VNPYRSFKGSARRRSGDTHGALGGQVGEVFRSEAERVFDELSKDGRIVRPLEKTFWAERFGMVVDRFAVPWLINCEGPGEPA